jgi:formiminoglutamase
VLMHPNFSLFSAQQRDELTSRRIGETKLGERVGVPAGGASMEETLTESPASFVLIGIPEDIGVRANGGVGGTQTAWPVALKAFLNVQSIPSLSGEELLVLGAFDFEVLLKHSHGLRPIELRPLVEEVDAAVRPIVDAIVRAGKIPLVVGGGHNNALPIIRGAAAALGGPIAAINVDAHSDCRPVEGRHSGNPFRYAMDEGILHRYAALGLHEAYNGAEVVAALRADPRVQLHFFEDIFLRERYSWDAAVDFAVEHTSGHSTGIELDLDCITGTLSSAATPAGLPAMEARRTLYRLARGAEIAYLHLPEGAARLSDGRHSALIGKLIATLLLDFIRGVNERG